MCSMCIIYFTNLSFLTDKLLSSSQYENPELIDFKVLKTTIYMYVYIR
jgi:hypothetical protein